MFSKKIQITLAAAAGSATLLGVVAASAPGASAATHRTTSETATTKMVARPDSGGNGDWAYDNFTRELVLTYQGPSGNATYPYAYTAQLIDKGSFKDMPGAFTPNQGGRYLGDILKPTQVSGSMAGGGYFYVFYSSVKANGHNYANLGVPTRVKGSADPSSTWPTLAFPATATFLNLGEQEFGYTYIVPAYTTTHVVKVNGKNVTVKVVHKAQEWTDASYNDAGQLTSAGNITGR
jgi:hypothetical protein